MKKIKRYIKAYISYIRWRFVDHLPTRINNEWYNTEVHMEGGNRLHVHDKEWCYIPAKVGDAHVFIFSNGMVGMYEITRLWHVRGDWMFDEDAVHVNLKLVPGIIHVHK